ncbi:hypothetical protein BFS30_24460 [Pedobacter steynii]|uniref:Uncharacterized protein n=2 Tax=Pedobacter steynii TaxID=430522 RepID=A0A1D7QN01_9SPHI|nr:hypothetical protein BFS30_24460 [Pedobacter steynii]
MSGGEKRYFSKFSKSFNVTGEQPMFLQLFQYLENAESELPKIFFESSPQALTTTKRRLYQNILKSLRSMNEDKSIDISIGNQLADIEILYHLNLPEQGAFIINNTRRLAASHERFGLLLQVLEWEKRLNIVLDKPTRSAEEILAEEQKVLQQFRQVMDLENIYGKAKTLKKQYGYVKGKMKKNLERETIAAPAMVRLTDCLSEKARYYYYFIYALHSWMVFDHDQAYRYSKHLLSTAAEVILPDDYIEGILEHITSCVCMGFFEEALNGLEISSAYMEIHKLDQSPAFVVRMFAYNSVYRLIIYNYMGSRSKLRNVIKETESKLIHYEKLLSFEIRQVILGNLMNAYVGIGNLHKADEIWNSMFNKQAKTIRRDIYADLYLFRLFSLLQARNYSLLQPATLAASRYYHKFKDAPSLFEFEMPIVNLFTKQIRLDKPEAIEELLSQIKVLIDQYNVRLKGKATFQEHYTRYLIWIDSLINNSPYNEVAAKWYKSSMV